MSLFVLSGRGVGIKAAFTLRYHDNTQGYQQKLRQKTSIFLITGNFTTKNGLKWSFNFIYLRFDFISKKSFRMNILLVFNMFEQIFFGDEVESEIH